VILGDYGVGQTCLRNRFIKGTFENVSHTMIPGNEVEHVENRLLAPVAFHIWDTAGQEQWQSVTLLRKSRYRSCYDLTGEILPIVQTKTANHISGTFRIIVAGSVRLQFFIQRMEHDQRVINLFLCEECVSPEDIHACLEAQFGDVISSERSVRWWCQYV
jgi:GTPase SAR1 family protein